jgi:hypothetical protein
MKKSLWVLLFAVVVLGGSWLARDWASAQGPKEKANLDQKILDPDNWHKAIFNGVEYTIYTGPGTILTKGWAPPQGPAKPALPPPKAAEPKPVAPRF